MSQSSGCYDSDSAEPCPTDDTADGHPYPTRDGARGSGLRRQAIQNWHRRPYRNSTEGEEGDVSDVGSRTTESEAEGWEPDGPGSAASRPTGSCRLTGETAPGSSGGVGGWGGLEGGGRGRHPFPAVLPGRQWQLTVGVPQPGPRGPGARWDGWRGAARATPAR